MSAQAIVGIATTASMAYLVIAGVTYVLVADALENHYERELAACLGAALWPLLLPIMLGARLVRRLQRSSLPTAKVVRR